METDRPEKSGSQRPVDARLPAADGPAGHPGPVFLTALAAAAVAHVVIFYVLTGGALPSGFPVHHDDFRNLSYTRPVWVWTLVRPLSDFLLTCLSTLGVGTFYVALHLLLVLYQALVLTAVFLLLRLPRTSFLLFLGAAIPAQAFESTAEVFLYTGLVTNLLSGVLGTAAICLLIAGIRSDAGRSGKLAAGVGLFTAALLAKEDFVLPVLLVFGWEAFASWRASRRLDRRVWLAGGALFLIPAAHVLGSRFLFQDAFLFATHPAYRPVFRLRSLATTLVTYLFTWRGSIAICVLGLAVTVFWVSLRREGVLRAAVTTLVPFAIMAPYVALPLHIAHYYSFFWLCWISGLALGLDGLRIGTHGPAWSRAAVAGLLLASAAILWLTDHHRHQLIAWYSSLADVNRNIVATLARSRDALSGRTVVAVTGVPDFNPWFYTDAGFLRNRLGLSCRWEIFVPEESNYYRLEVLDPNRPIRSRVVTRRLPELAVRPDLPVLRLLKDGSGEIDLRRAIDASSGDSPSGIEVLGGGLNRPSGGRITGWVVGNGFEPGDRLRIEGDVYPVTVFGNSGWLTFDIDESLVTDRPELRVEVLRTGSPAAKGAIILKLR